MLKLFSKYLDNQCSPEEVRALLAHFNSPENEAQLRSLILDSLIKSHAFEGDVDMQWSEAAASSFHQIKEQISGGKTKVIPFYKRTWIRIAASVVIVLSVVSFFFLQKKEQKPIAVEQKEKKFENDIAPGGDKAVLTLADGRKIILDNTQNGTIAHEGAADVTKTSDGQLVYTAVDGNTAEVFYNTVSTPRGGKYRLALPDGSKVWLNASSSIRFPNVFNGNERKVEITGEAYFEVTKNKAKPFMVSIVSADGKTKGEVEVLGTHFNINSYDDEDIVRTTLIEGAVKVKQGSRLWLLSPGQQAQMDDHGIQLKRDVDIEAIIAWKNDKFIFTYDNIQTVMRQLERWYDIEVEYKGGLSKEEFEGIISRNVTISQMLNMLEKSGGDVYFEVKGRKVIVNKKL